MLILTSGDIFLSEAQTIVNPVNCVGIMGAGLAKQFAEFYPEMYIEYKNKCERREIEIGELWLYKRDDKDWVLNFPTKDHWESPSKYSYIIKGLETFVANYEEWEITSITFPILGAGLGKLHPGKVLGIMRDYLDDLPITVDIVIQYRDDIVPEEVE